MSERKVVGRFVNGAPVYAPPEEVTHADIQAARQRGRSKRAAFEEEYEARRSVQNPDPHREAVEHFDVRFKDLHEPVLLQEVWNERQRRINQAAEKGEAIHDWEEFYRGVGNTVRKKVGRPTVEEEERFSAMEEARKARRVA